MKLRFAKPSIPRLLGSIAGVALAVCVVSGILLAAYSALTVADAEAEKVTAAEWVRWVIMCLIFWGPVYAMIAWPISVPVIAVLGVLAGSVRTRRSPAAARSAVPPPGPAARTSTPGP